MPKKIILDCDPGHDDAVAIMLAAASKEIESLGVKSIPIKTDIRFDDQVEKAIKKVID